MKTSILSNLVPYCCYIDYFVPVPYYSGDTNAAMLNVMFYVGASIWSGCKLSICKERYAQAHRLMKEYNHFAFLIQTTPMERNIMRMIGTSSGDVDRADAEAENSQDLEELNGYLCPEDVH